MGAFLRIILFCIIFYYILKTIGRFFLPFFISSKIQKAEKEKRKARADYISRKKSEEGKVTIENLKNSKKDTNYSQGEYIDYEEIK